MSTKFRAPTVQEAVDSIMRCVLIESRQEQLSYFQREYGDNFADQVKSLVKAKWKKK